MLARLQQAIVIGLVAIAAAWAAHFFQGGRPLMAAAGALLIGFGYVVVLGVEFGLLALVHRDDPAPRATVLQLLRAWWGEVTTATRVFCWRQPFRSHAVPDDDAPLPGSRAVLLVHGFVCNRGFWTPWLLRLRSLGVRYVAVNLEPVFGSIDDYADLLEEAVVRLERATGQPPVIVAHSMGGIASRVWLARPGNAPRIERLITIGTPHRGTWLARFGHTHNGRQMRIDNPWLLDLVAREAELGDDQGPRVPPNKLVCFYGNCDNIVFPPSTASLPGAENRFVPGFAHVAMAFAPAVMEPALALIAGDRLATSAPPRSAPLTPPGGRSA